jgi:hypothetical protein
MKKGKSCGLRGKHGRPRIVQACVDCGKIAETRKLRCGECIRLARNARHNRYGNRHGAIHMAVHRAVKSGKLVVERECQLCGSNENIHLHHEDYDRPLDVVPLCRVCHVRVHHKLKYG